ncbi:hypothetical protein ABWL39_11005 [Chitinivorax sp. PXF-14]|uniref:hypothetical protein n=1 Tax=Chitinivorax sp. PXF-14 TaxID=3230488 RepID=UPI0034678E4F
MHYRVLTKALAAAGLLLGLQVPAFATLINFDNVADATAIDSTYAGQGVTFSNPLGGSIFARATPNAESPGNVVSVLNTGIPAFDARFGAVDAVFSSAQRFVSIDAAILRVPEGLGTPINFPKLEIYDTNNVFVTAVNWDFSQIPQPGAGGITDYETLSYTAAADTIGKVRFLSGQPGGSPSNFGLFDNLEFRQGPTNPLPLPSSVSLLVLGLAGLAAMRWQHRA